MRSEPTAELVERARRGERDALEALARAYLRPAYAVALAILGRPADAEDAAQDALVAALGRIGTCRDPAAFPAWLLQIARNRARNLRASRSLREPPGGERGRDAGPRVEAVERAGAREALLAALAELSGAQREVVLLHDLEGWTHGEIAAAAGISETMSRQHLFNARKSLRARLAAHAPSGA